MRLFRPGSASDVRAGAVTVLIVLVLLLVPCVVWYGVPFLWRDLPKEVRRACLTLWRGKRGPYPGIVW